MRSRRLPIALLCLALLALPAAAPAADDPASLVDPFIGTLGSGFVFPGPAAPYGMVQLSPDTEGFFAYTGYMYGDQMIRGFSHVHVQSMGVREGGQLPFMPTTGAPSSDYFDYQSPFNHATESASPGYYRVLLEKYGIDAELTAGTRVGMHRYTFPPVADANVLLDIGRQIPGGTNPDRGQSGAGTNLARVTQLDARTVTGTSNVDLAAPHNYAVHFAAQFDRPIERFGTWTTRGGPVAYDATSVEGVGSGAALRFDATEDRDVVVTVGISFVSPENALANLAAELPGSERFDFSKLQARTRHAWSDALSVIDVEGGTLAEQRSFYTALYHAQHHPNVFNDVNGEYLGHDGQVHTIGAEGDPMPSGSTYYANYSMWDTYRAEMPLLMLIAPDRMKDMMRSLAAMIEHGHAMPRWAMMNRNPNFMNGEPALQVISDAYCRGLVPDDALGTLYSKARDVALVSRRDANYLSKGYIAEASGTLEYALGDFALAIMADSLGETEDRDALLASADNWRNVFDPETRFVRPRNPNDGSWRTPYYPEMPDGFREGTGWQYTWLVPQDLRGLFDEIGDETIQRLDTFFSTALTGTVPIVMPEVQQKLTAYGIAYYGNQYAPSNEHDLQAPWIYNWAGQPWKTQMIQRGYQSLYRAAPDGLPGNDDLGTMSAWFVWSALGFYPVTPGSPTYTIGSPLFTEATIHSGDKQIVVDAPGASAAGRYVQSASIGDDPLGRTWFTHHDLLAGSVRIEMGATPNLDWGSERDDAPPSQSTHTLGDFACSPSGT